MTKRYNSEKFISFKAINLKKCIKSSNLCIGRDCRELIINGNFELCCREEIQDEQELVQNIVDAIDDCKRDSEHIRKISCRLSFGASTINQNNQDDLVQVLPVVKRFSQLIYEFQEKIVHDHGVGDLVYSFAHEIQRWFSYNFLGDNTSYQHPVQAQSIIADMDTIEMALGVCMLPDYSGESSLDDLFF